MTLHFNFPLMARALSAMIVFASASTPAFADDAGDTAESDFYSQKPPDYDAIERQQRLNSTSDQQPASRDLGSRRSSKHRT